MARRRTKSTFRRRATSRRALRETASERWLLLIMVVAFIAMATSLFDLWSPWRSRADPDRVLTMAEARASNAVVPIERSRRVNARPYRFRGGLAARAQAVDCLATAALYEAGEDQRGQKAVIQVVLNRVRAPGYPKTVCGVVYQGYARTTGCQFSFTCDGSLQRRPVRAGWGAARRAARRALDGHVFAEVGGATHYHTDWIVPYWRDTLSKVARVGTHLFYVRRRSRPAALSQPAEVEG